MTDLLNAIALGLLALLPLTNPPTTVALFIALSEGPGTIAMIISSSATIKHSTLFPAWVLLTAPPLIFLFTSIILWVCLRSSGLIMKILGESGIDAISRLMGFLLVCMGAQFAINGSIEIVQTIIDNNFHLPRPQ